MENITNKFKITTDDKISLKDFDTKETVGYKKEDAAQLLDELIEKTSELHSKLYADNRHGLLIIFQAMDAAGKDSAIKHTFSGLNPQGCQVYSFKQPSSEELDHDFLWRHYKALPERGRIGIHNRSHYENVLVTKVHPEYVLKENLPGISSADDLDEKFWKHRYDSIRDFEKHLTRNGITVIKFFLHVSKDEQKERFLLVLGYMQKELNYCNGITVIKFFLHVSKDEQKERFLARIDDEEKNWKFSAADIQERKHWKQYMEAYEEAIAETATEDAPWYILPADKKWFTRIAISTIIHETLKGLDMQYPVLPEEEKERLAEIKRMLLSEE